MRNKLILILLLSSLIVLFGCSTKISSKKGFTLGDIKEGHEEIGIKFKSKQSLKSNPVFEIFIGHFDSTYSATLLRIKETKLEIIIKTEEASNKIYTEVFDDFFNEKYLIKSISRPFIAFLTLEYNYSFNWKFENKELLGDSGYFCFNLYEMWYNPYEYPDKYLDGYPEEYVEEYGYEYFTPNYGENEFGFCYGITIAYTVKNNYIYLSNT